MGLTLLQVRDRRQPRAASAACAARSSVRGARFPVSQVVDGDGRHHIGRRETEDGAVEEQFGFQTADDGVGPSESVLLTA